MPFKPYENEEDLQRVLAWMRERDPQWMTAHEVALMCLGLPRGEWVAGKILAVMTRRRLTERKRAPGGTSLWRLRESE